MGDSRPRANIDKVRELLTSRFLVSFLADSASLTNDEKAQVSAVLRNVELRLKQSGWLYSVNNWWWQGGCVVASEERAKYLIPVLPSSWTVTSYTHFTVLHTWNVIYFTASNGSTYYWRADTYLAGTTLIDYLGTTIPSWMYKTPENGTYSGGRPGRGW